MPNSFEPGQTRDEKIDKFLDTLAWFHSEKTMPTGLFATIGRIDEKLGKLNENIQNAGTRLSELNQNIESANNSSTKLTGGLKQNYIGRRYHSSFKPSYDNRFNSITAI